jgi:uncharacterized membrane protein YfcA
MRFLRAFGRFWYDFIIGDDWKIACAVALVMVVGAVLAAAAIIPSHVLAPLLGVALLGVFAVAVLVDVRR